MDEIAEPVEIDIVATPDGYIEDDLYCSGHALTLDGDLFTVGGNQRHLHTTQPSESFGLRTQTLFDWQTAAWSRLPGGTVGLSPSGRTSRWYPTVTRLPDGRMLIAGGFDTVLPQPVWNGTAEIWDPTTGRNVVISPYGWTPPELMSSSYTHSFVLPEPIDGRQILSFGETGVAVLMNTSGATATWNVRNTRPRPGAGQFTLARLITGRGRWNSAVAPNWGASSAPLPIMLNNGANGYSNGSVVIAGGPPATEHIGAIDTYDPISNGWRAADMFADRNVPMTVALPDGRLLVLGGAGSDDVDLQHAEYLDPRDGFSVQLGSSASGEVRGYHATSILLPDGRVLVAGGRGIDRAGTFEKPSMRYYEPDYMTKDRPELLWAPTNVTPAVPYAIWTDRPITELMYVALGSQTHSFDFNQRVVQVPVLGNIPYSASQNIVIGGGVPGPQTLPPGYYMVFALDAERVPSVAQFVKVDKLP